LFPFTNVWWFARAGSRLSSGFLLPGISLGCTRTHVCVCELVLEQPQTACFQRRARATRRPARRWHRHGAAGWAALGAGAGLALATCLKSALWRTWRQMRRRRRQPSGHRSGHHEHVRATDSDLRRGQREAPRATAPAPRSKTYYAKGTALRAAALAPRPSTYDINCRGQPPGHHDQVSAWRSGHRPGHRD
jgi:hypothetical protein